MYSNRNSQQEEGGKGSKRNFTNSQDRGNQQSGSGQNEEGNSGQGGSRSGNMR